MKLKLPKGAGVTINLNHVLLAIKYGKKAYQYLRMKWKKWREADETRV